jgi:glutathione S-transferase
LSTTVRARERGQLATEALNEQFQIGDGWLAGREYFFDHFTAPDAHFYWCCRRAMQLGVDIAGLANIAAHTRRMEQRPSVKKFRAFERK